MPQPILSLENVDFAYGRQQVLHQLSFHVNRGEVVGLLSPNGADKSTTLRLLAGILSSDRGEVTVCGYSMPYRSFEAKREIGFVPDTDSLFDFLSPQELLELIGRLHAIDEPLLQSRIAEMMALFGLTEAARQPLKTFSKGDRQKVMLALALLHNPQVVLLDEPLTGLDANAAILVRDLLLSLAAAGKTILYSSHILDVVEKFCNRVLILHEGRILASGPPAEIRERTRQSTLEGAFHVLTQKGGKPEAETQDAIARFVGRLQQ